MKKCLLKGTRRPCGHLSAHFFVTDFGIYWLIVSTELYVCLMVSFLFLLSSSTFPLEFSYKGKHTPFFKVITLGIHA